MLNNATRDYMRAHFQERLAQSLSLLQRLPADATAEIATLLRDVRDITLLLEDVMTQHMDAPAPAEPVEQPRETRAALHLYHNVLKSADVIRDMEIKLGLSDEANTKPHNLLRDMTRFIESERRHGAGVNVPAISVEAVADAVAAHRNGKHKERHATQ
jgi:hypothetical protein